MQQTSTAYGRALAQDAKAPIYLVAFDGITVRFSTGPVLNPLAETRKYLRIPEGAGMQITPDEGRASIGGLTVGILDVDGYVTNLAFLYQMANRVVTVKQGFQGMSEAAYSTVFKGRVLNYTLDADNSFWKFSISDFQRDTKQDIFTALTKTTAPVGIGDATISVSNTAQFATATAGQFYFRIDDEVISYTGVTSTTFTGCVRGELGTAAAVHNADTQTANLVVLEGNPLTLALQILTSTGLGTNGTYDVLPASCGLAIPEDQVNVVKFETERDRWTTGIVFKFEEEDRTEGKRFLEEQIYRLIPGYPVTGNDGRLGFKVAGPPLPTSISNPLNDDNIVQRPSFMGNVLDRYFFNELDLGYDYNFLTKTFAQRVLFEDAPSQETFDTVKTKTIDSRGMRTATTGITRINNFGLRFLKRYAIPSPIIAARGFFSTRLIEVGDIIPLSSTKLPNLATGKIGVESQLMEVIQADPLYPSGAVQYSLLNTPYAYGRRYGAISPTTRAPVNFPNYLAATAAQRGYAFISQKVNATKGIMSNGDDGYYTTP